MAKKKSDSFIFYRSFYEALKDVDDTSASQVFKAICEYALDGKEEPLTGVSSALFKLIKPQIDANNKRRAAGSKGGKASVEARKQSSELQSNLQPNVNHTSNGASNGASKQNQANVNVNSNVNVNENENPNEECSNSNVNDQVTTTMTTTTLTNNLPFSTEWAFTEIMKTKNWGEPTAKIILQKFIDLNQDHFSKNWNMNIWASRLQKFLNSENIPHDYKKWEREQQPKPICYTDKEGEYDNELPFS